MKMHFLMNLGVRRALSHGPSEGEGQEWLFPTEGHSWPHSQTPGTGRCMWGTNSLLQKLNRECRKNSVFFQTRQKFSTFSLLKILKQYFVWALSQVNVPTCTSSHPASHIFLADYKADKPTKDHRYSYDAKQYFGGSKPIFVLPQFEF